MKIFDITIPLSNQTPVWEGDKEVIISRETQISEEEDYNVARVALNVHSGTHMDAPFHVMKDGRTVDQISLENLIGKAQVVRIGDEVDMIDAEVLKQSHLEKGIKRFLFKTKNSNYWKEEPYKFCEDFVGLDSSAADYLVSVGARLAGIDWFSISPMSDLLNPHKILLGAGIVILENLNLLDIQGGIYDLFCLPLKLVGTDGAPVRAILTREE